MRRLSEVGPRPAEGAGRPGSALLAGCVLLGFSLGCNATLGSGSEDGTANGGPGSGSGGNGGLGSGGGSGTGPDGEPLPMDPKSQLTARAWRLSHEQYRNSVVDLVGVEPDLQNFAPESGNGVYANFSSTAFVRVDLAANYYDVAKSIALDLPTVSLAALTSCDLSAACRDTFIAELGAKAFRGPVPTEVAARLASLFDLTTGKVDAETGYRAVLAAVLNSPLFLYRKEIGPETAEVGAQVELTKEQIAELLSYSLLNGPPPQWLRDEVAISSDLGAALPDIVDRLITQPEFTAQLRAFLAEWLEVTHFESVEKTDAFPGFDGVKEAMVEEVHAFLEQSGSAESDLVSLFLDPVPSVSESLDEFYFSDPSAPQVGERLGVLGLGAVLSSHAKSYLTSPTLRGTFIRERFFCQEITLPPGFNPPPLSETEVLGEARTTRELYERHLTDPSCSTCHDLTDNIGFALEAFDGAGRFRTEDSTQGPPVPLDLNTELTLSDVNRPLANARDLSVALTESDEVRHCLAKQAFRFYFGQVESEEAEPAAIDAGYDGFKQQGSLRGLLVALLSSENSSLRILEGEN